MKIIPIMAAAGVSGFESPAAEYLQLPLSLDELLIQHPSATFIGRACGDSMEGVGIFDRDILIVDRHVKVNNHDVVVANYQGEFICKILDTQHRLLLSANDSHQAVEILSGEKFALEGVVTRSIRCHRATQSLG